MYVLLYIKLYKDIINYTLSQLTNSKNMKDLEPHFQKGIVNDTRMACYHKLIHDKLAKKYDDIIQLDEPMQNLIGHIQNTSVNSTILFLSKIMERKNKRHPNRSFYTLKSKVKNNTKKELLKSTTCIEHLKSKYKPFEKELLEKMKIDEFLDLCDQIIKSDHADLIESISNFRNKSVAHNQYCKNGLGWIVIDPMEIDDLLNFFKSIIFVLSNFYFHVHYTWIESDSALELDTFFIDELLEKLGIHSE